MHDFADLYGLDTERLAARAWHDAAASEGVAFDGALAERMVGHNFVDCGALLRAHCPRDYPIDAVLSRWHRAYDAIVEREGIARKPGAIELLDWLAARNIARAVATSTRRSRALAKLEQAGLLTWFTVVVGGDDVARGKPAPDTHLEAAQRLGVPPAVCVVLEDSEPGVRGALAAGMTPIMIPDLLPPSTELLAVSPWVEASLVDVVLRLAELPA